LDAVEGVFVTGGYPLFLLERAQASGFVEAVRDGARAGRLAYVGVSAGAALAGPDISPLANPDDPGRATDTGCIGLVDFVVIPHVDRHPPEVFEGRRRMFQDRFPLWPLRDDQAVAVVRGQVAEVPSV